MTVMDSGIVRGEERPNEANVGADSSDNWRTLSTEIGEMATPHGAFYLLVVLSAVIASFGLLANSTAVVIGAMLVAPLMGPIFGIAFGLATADNPMLAKSVSAEAKGVLVAVGVAWLIGLVPPHPEFRAEILSRTSPTVYDIAVAVAAGLAGAFALVDTRISPALPGVAIATAIVPPLGAAGLCLSAGRFDLAGGALLLFFANLLAIELTATAYFTIVGVRKGHLHSRFRPVDFVRHFSVSLGLLVLIGAFMTRTLIRGIAANRERANIRTVLGDALRTSQGARLTEMAVEPGSDTTSVLATVLTPQELLPEHVARLEDALRREVSPMLHLVVRSIISKDADRNGRVFVAEDEVQKQTLAAQQTAFLSTASAVITRSLASEPGVELVDLRRDPGDSADVITAVVRTPTAVAPPQVDSLTSELSSALATPVVLVVRSIITRDADRSRFLYEPVDTAPKPAPVWPRRRR
ncbi:MAG: TIGR00341 family protein [Gemmatimonadaceae bacterium]